MRQGKRAKAVRRPGSSSPVVGRREEQLGTLELLFGVWLYDYHFFGFGGPLVDVLKSPFEF